MGALLCSSVFAAAAPSASASSDPYADGQTIRWSGDGWWQVQDGESYEQICAGGIDELNSCDVGRTGTFIVVNHSTDQRWYVEVTSSSSSSGGSDPSAQRPLSRPTLQQVEYNQAGGYVSVVWQSVASWADGVNLYRDGRYAETVTNGTVWNDFAGRPGMDYSAVAFRDGTYSEQSDELTATVEWFPELDYSDAEDRIRDRLYSRHLSDATSEQIVRAGGSAFGDRQNLIRKWHRDAGGEIHSTGGVGRVRCGNLYHDTRIYLPDRTTDFTIVHELIHVIDCSKSGRPLGDGQINGIGDGMSSADRRTLVAERDRLYGLNNSGNRPWWLRPYSFTNRGEFFADVSAWFLTSERHRTAMAIEAPVLYETLRSYYGKSHWTSAGDIAWHSDLSLPRP